MDRLDALKVFCAVVDEGGFSRAAAKLGISTSSVTHQIGLLETHFGVRLLNRTTRSMSLIDEGRRCIEQARRLLDEMDDLESNLSDALHEPRGSLRVDMPGILAQGYVAPALPRFLAAYPELSVRLTASDRLIDMVDEGVDVMLRSGALVPLLEPWQAAGPEVSVLYPQRHQRAAKIKVFVDFVEELFRNAAASWRPSA
jgi:LysR family transcriptional regulator for bpeEF and oprC